MASSEQANGIKDFISHKKPAENGLSGNTV